ncbi:MAG: fibronectin type III domain-containing protein, partial [Planctomycetaceae bacterium]
MESWKRARMALSFGVALAAGGARAHDDGPPHTHAGPPPAVSPFDAHRPSRLPDRVILFPGADPARGAAVAWRTGPETTGAVAQVAAATDGPEFRSRAVTIPARSTRLETDLGPCRCHEAALVDLEPDTPYAYRVGDGVNWSEWFQFTTAPAGPRRLRFVHFGDAQNDILSA